MRLELPARRCTTGASVPRMSMSRRDHTPVEDQDGRFIVTPSPEPTESMMGFVLRLTEANGYPTISYVLASVHGHWYRSKYGRLDAAPLGELAGASKADIARLTMRPHRKPRAYIRVCGCDLPCYEVALTRPKVCPLCLRATGCEAFWDLAQAVACPMHGVMLVDRCGRCGSRLTWTRSKIAQCACGADLTKMRAAKAEPALCELMAALRHFVYRDESVAPFPIGMQHLRHLGLRRFCKLLWVMSGVLHHKGGSSSLPKARHHYLPELKRLARALADWPNQLQQLLGELYDEGAGRERNQIAFRPTFSWLFIRLIKNDEGSGAPYAFLEEQAYRYGAKHWTRGAMLGSGGGSLPSDVQPRWGTAGEAVSILGIHPASLRRLVRSGEAPTRVVNLKSALRGTVIDLDWVRQQHITGQPSIRAREAAGLVGVSASTLKCMRDLGLYEAKHRGDGNSEWAREDLDALIRKLRDLVPSSCTSKAGAPTINEVMARHRASSLERAEFFKEIMASPALIVGRKGRTFSAGEMRVDCAGADAIVATMRRNKKLVSAQFVAKRLQCSADVVTGLKRAGHLKTGLDRGREAILQDSLAGFEGRYEVLGSVVSRLGGCVRRAYHRLPLQEIRHLGVKGTQVTTVFVDRRDLPLVEKIIVAFGVTARTARGSIGRGSKTGSAMSVKSHNHRA